MHARAEDLIPRDLRGKVALSVTRDAFGLRAVLHVYEAKPGYSAADSLSDLEAAGARHWTCTLIPVREQGGDRIIGYTIPDDFIALLCVSLN